MNLTFHPSKALFASLLCLLICIGGFAQSSNSKLSDNITAANNRFCDLFSKGGDLSTLYCSDAMLCPPNSDFVRGADSIRSFWKGALDAGVKKVKLETVSLESGGPIAQETGKYTIYGADEKVLDTGKYVVVWKKESGNWKLYRDIWNTSTPAPMASK